MRMLELLAIAIAFYMIDFIWGWRLVWGRAQAGNRQP
jgi:hypothetical protein